MNPDRHKSSIPSAPWYVRSSSALPMALILGTALIVIVGILLLHPPQVVEAGDPRQWVTVHLTVAVTGASIGVATVLAVIFAAERIGWRLAVAAQGYDKLDDRVRDLELVHQDELLALHRKRIVGPREGP